MSQTYSNVGDRRAYEAGDQRNYSKEELEKERFADGKANSHMQLDSKDERSIANKLERESKIEDSPAKQETFEQLQAKIDPTLPARTHGNEPSKGAKIDAELQAEDEMRVAHKIADKGSFGSKQQ